MVSALELTAQNIMCGSVRMVYAIIYTLFLVSLHTVQRTSRLNGRTGLRPDDWV